MLCTITAFVFFLEFAVHLRRLFSRTVWTSLALACAQLSAQAQTAAGDYPTRAVKLLVANGPGSAPDILARQLGQQLTKGWSQPVLVDNKGSAGGVSAVDAVVKSAPDGHTLLVGGDGAITIMPHLQQHLPYDVRQDVVPVAKLGQVDFVLVAHPRAGFKTVQDLVQAAKAKPGRLNYASAGAGSALHLSMELLKQRAGFFATHIPYRGGPQGLQDVLAGQVDAMFIAVAPALAHIQSGKLVALAVSGAQRNPLLPQVPTVGETYPGFQSATWFGLFAPKGTPQPLLQQLTRDTQQALADPQLRRQLAQQGIQTTGETQQAFAKQVQGDYARYAQLVQTIGLKLE